MIESRVIIHGVLCRRSDYWVDGWKREDVFVAAKVDVDSDARSCRSHNRRRSGEDEVSPRFISLVLWNGHECEMQRHALNDRNGGTRFRPAKISRRF